MDRIEGAVRLPQGARPLRDYARFYAPRKGGAIIAIYSVPSPPISANDRCDELRPDLTSRPVECGSLSAASWESVTANERRWVAERELPRINDGGCSVVNVVYDPRRQVVVSAACNGPA